MAKEPKDTREYEFRLGSRTVHIGITKDEARREPGHLSDQDILDLIVRRFRERRSVQVPGYNKFGYLGETDSALEVSREAGQPTRIPYAKLLVAISAARKDPVVYDGGPSKLRQYGITHINSPLWALLHLVSKEELME